MKLFHARSYGWSRRMCQSIAVENVKRKQLFEQNDIIAEPKNYSNGLKNVYCSQS